MDEKSQYISEEKTREFLKDIMQELSDDADFNSDINFYLLEGKSPEDAVNGALGLWRQEICSRMKARWHEVENRYSANFGNMFQ